MASSVDDIMSIAEMRPILATAKQEPISVALVLTADKAAAAVLASKKHAPKKVRAELRSQSKKLKLEIDAATVRFGTAVVDEEKAGLLLFRVNKSPSPALVAKVRERMRKASWSNIEFVVDEALEQAPEEDGETVADDGVASPAPDIAAPDTAAPDIAALRQELAALIGQIPSAVAAGTSMDALRPHAAAANEAIKEGTDLAKAAAEITLLREALATAGATAGPGVDADDLLATFRDAKDDVDAGLNKLGEQLRASGDVDMLQIADYGLYGMTDGGGVGLLKALFDLRGSAPEKRAAALQSARDAAAAYKAAVLSDNVVDLVDANPFGVEVGIKSKLVPALDKIANAA